MSLMPAASSEEALKRYQHGHRAESVEEVVSVIDFRAEALAILKRARLNPRLTDEEVSELATSRESELRELYAKRGFGGGLNVGACEVVIKFEDSPLQHRFVLQDQSRQNAVNVFPLVFQKNAAGWFLVRGS